MKKLSIQLLADTVLNKRKEKNISQQELANQTRINRTMISHLESKDYMPSITQLEALANTLDFDITEFEYFAAIEPSRTELRATQFAF